MKAIKDLFRWLWLHRMPVLTVVFFVLWVAAVAYVFILLNKIDVLGQQQDELLNKIIQDLKREIYLYKKLNP